MHESEIADRRVSPPDDDGRPAEPCPFDICKRALEIVCAALGRGETKPSGAAVCPILALLQRFLIRPDIYLAFSALSASTGA